MARKILFFILFLIACGVAVYGILAYYHKSKTKSLSPEVVHRYENDAVRIRLFYNAPSKRHREIFGKLVPYHHVWRLGANEPTTFFTTKPLRFHTQTLPAGEYSLWAMPSPTKWVLFFDSHIPSWGIDANGQANMDKNHIVAEISSPPIVQEKVFEKLSLTIEKKSDEYELVVMWDTTIVSFPFTLLSD